MHPPPTSGPSSSRGENAGSNLSALAVSALVVALVPCCPVTGLVGAFLGLFALRRIQRSGARLRGARIAVMAMVVGAVGSIVWAVAFERFAMTQQKTQEAAIAEQIGDLLLDAQEGRAAEVVAAWFPGVSAPSAEAVVEFGTAVTDRYGAVDRFAILSTARSGAFMSPELVVAGIYHAESEAPIGSAKFRMVFAGRLTPAFRPMQLVIEDPDRGDLVLGGP